MIIVGGRGGDDGDTVVVVVVHSVRQKLMVALGSEGMRRKEPRNCGVISG